MPPARATNIALLVLTPLAVLTGGVAFLVGSGPIAVVVVAHGVVGIAVLFLVPWKSVIARRGLRRARPDRLLSLLLALAVLLALFTGFAHSAGFLIRVGSLSAMQVHVGAALAALVPLALHVWRRPIKPRRIDLSRRNVLRLATLGLAAGAGYTVLETAASLFSLRGADRRGTGSYEVSSGRPDGMPATIWLLDNVPDLDPSTWRVTITADGRTRHWTVDQLRSFGHRRTVALDCTTGWWSRQIWSGARLCALLPSGVSGTAEVTSATGYTRRLPLSDDLLLAVDVGGRPLSEGHGAPVRLVVPGRRGFHWVKWVKTIETDHAPWWLEPPFPVQ